MVDVRKAGNRPYKDYSVVMDAAALLRETRLARGLNQTELARRAGTAQTYVSRIERGVVSPSLDTLERLVHAMGRRLTLATEPLSPGNVSRQALRADYCDLTAAQRVQQTSELSAFLTDIAAVASQHGQSSSGSRRGR